MQKQLSTTFRNQFEEDVYTGLTDSPKHLSSKYFYDARGDKLFQDIMNMPEYYLTNSEAEIFELNKESITNWFTGEQGTFNLIELGAGDGKKTKILLEQLLKKKAVFNYMPVDISQNALDKLEASLNTELPELNVKPLQGSYFDVLEELNVLSNTKNVILFLGSNIGNLLHPQAVTFLKSIQQLMKKEDLLFVGFDQKKNPRAILDAYNDAGGITAAFNKNVLIRINRELGANFDPDNFLHWEVYDPETGTAKSYLVSKIPQKVSISALALELNFKAWETIHTEISQKYDDEVVTWLTQQAGLQIEAEFNDKDNFYKNYIFSKNI